jgi:hypothetical protein
LELLCIDASSGGESYREVPCSGHDLGVAEGLPILNVEVAIGLVKPDQAFHYESIRHQIPLSAFFPGK